MNANVDRPRIRLIAFWVYTALLVVATHIPNSVLPTIEFLWFDKIEHATAYGLWTMLLFMSGLLGENPLRVRAARALLWSSLFALADELLQMIPALNRVADPVDVIADVFGSACVVCAIWVRERRLKSRDRRA